MLSYRIGLVLLPNFLRLLAMLLSLLFGFASLSLGPTPIMP